MPGGRTSHSVLPPAEMGTAQSSGDSCGNVNTVHTLQLTTEEVYLLATRFVGVYEPSDADNRGLLILQVGSGCW
jgi:hypothetical protein